jgi:hypothetical protein
MDPETLRDLEESLRQLSEVLDRQSTALNEYNTATSNAKTAVGNNTASVNSANTANNQVVQGMTRYGQTVSAVDEALKQNNAEFGATLKTAGRATLSFGKALVSAETSLTKYGSSANQLGDVAWDVGKNFGLFGKVIGGVLKGLGLAANSILTLNQNIISFRDDFTKQAGVLPMTTEKLGELSKQAGFAYNRMPILAKAVTNLGPSLLSLGGYAGEGAERFMRIADVGEDVRKKFSRMGVSQADLLEYQTLYVELQKSRGNALINREKTDKQIQQESLVYAERMMELSALTGEKASALQDRGKAALESIEEQSRVAQEDRKIAELRRLGTPDADAQIKRIEADRKLRQDTMEKIAITQGVKQAVEFGTAMFSGIISTTFGAQNNLIGVAATAKAKGVDEAANQLLDNTSDTIATFAGPVAQFNQSTFKELTGIETGKDIERILRVQNGQLEKIKKVQEEKGKEGGDNLAEAAASIQELEIEASKKFQEFLETIDPFRLGLENLKNAAIAATAVLGGGALLAGVAKIIGGKFGKIGSPGNPMYAKVVPGPTGAVGGIGAKLKSVFKRSAAPAAAAAGVAPAAAGPLAASGTGAAAIAAPAGSPGGSKVGIFLMGLSKGLAAAGKGATPVYMVAGAAAIGASIALIGAGIAGATWIIGKSLPSLASGLRTFDDVDGDNLKKLGIGMAGMAAGLLAIGGTKITDAMGSFAKWASGDDSNPIDNLQDELTKFQNLEVNPEKIEKNSKAFIAFNKMVAQATEINGTVAGALARAFGSFFEVPIPLDKFKDFSDLEINHEQAGKNATAFKLFAEAMSSYKGYGTISSLGIITRLLGGSVFSFFQSLPTDDPIKRFEKFSQIKIEGEQIKINANAFKDFANAMAEYKGGPGVFEAISQLAGAKMMSIFGVDGPVEAFAKFAREDFGPNMEKNADAFTKYANAASKLAGGGGASDSSPTSTGNTGSSSGSGADQSGGAGTTDQAGQGESDTTKSDGETTSDSGSSSTSTAPKIGAGKDAIIQHARKLSPSERAKFFQELSSQGMELAQAAGAAGDQERANNILESANIYHTLAKSSDLLAQSSSSATSFNDPSGTTRVAGMGSMFGTMIGMARGAVARTRASEVLNFTGKSGKFENFAMLDDDMQQSVVAAASEYKQVTGRNMQVNSGRRTRQDQERLWNETVRAGRPGIGPTGMLVAKPGHSPHERGNAIDLQEGKDDRRAKQILEKYGMYQRYGAKDPVHYELKRAADGGIFGQDFNEVSRKLDGLNPNSLIAKLGKTTAEGPDTLVQEEVTAPEIDLTPELLSMMENKLEKVLTALENNQSTHERILKNSM